LPGRTRWLDDGQAALVMREQSLRILCAEEGYDMILDPPSFRTKLCWWVPRQSDENIFSVRHQLLSVVALSVRWASRWAAA